jgi:hypothetical protein
MVSYTGPSGPNAAPLVEMGINDDDVNVYQVTAQMKVKMDTLAMFLDVAMELFVKFDFAIATCAHR